VFSEPVTIAPGERNSVLRVRSGGSEAAVSQSSVFLAADGVSGWLLLDPQNSLDTRFRKGDSVRIEYEGTGAVRDLRGNASPGSNPWVPVQFGMRPPLFKVDVYPFSVYQPKNPVAKSKGASVVVLVRPRGATDNAWTTLSGAPAGDIGSLLGPRIVSNASLGGMMYIYDNLGTFVAQLDMAATEKLSQVDGLPTDASGQYEIWLAWNGTSRNGLGVQSGVYTARLAMRVRTTPDDAEQARWTWVNQLVRMGWIIPQK
jgi:hypothetical protein